MENRKSYLVVVAVTLVLSFFFGFGCGQDNLRLQCKQHGIDLSILEHD